MNRLIDIKEVSSQTGICRTILYTLVKDDKFPQPVKIGRSTRFSERDVQAWIESQLANGFRKQQQPQSDKVNCTRHQAGGIKV